MRPDDPRNLAVARASLEGEPDALAMSPTATTEDAVPTLDQAAFYGLAGDIVETLLPQTEASAPALLTNVLVGAGCAIGSGPHARVGGAVHPARLYAVHVGQTSRGRKGQAWADVRPVLERADPSWAEGRILGGLASGEGLIAAVRDPDSDVDQGAPDKRALVVEPEFARVLGVAHREGNTVSHVIREAWDSGRLRVMTRSHPLVATGAHISILGHITLDEVRRKLTDTEAANGFANRFLWVVVSRSKLLPGGPMLDLDEADRLGSRLREVIEQARRFGVVTRTPSAEELWTQLYYSMADTDAGGLVGALTARAEAQVLRLSLAYALLDGCNRIDLAHLEAAWAVWRYCEQSAAYVFRDSLGDEVADRLLGALRRAGPDGLDGSQQQDVFARHVSKARLDTARELLELKRLVFSSKVDTGGRPRLVTVAAEFHHAR